jgi:hypothetical protein
MINFGVMSVDETPLYSLSEADSAKGHLCHMTKLFGHLVILTKKLKIN